MFIYNITFKINYELWQELHWCSISNPASVKIICTCFAYKNDSHCYDGQKNGPNSF